MVPSKNKATHCSTSTSSDIDGSVESNRAAQFGIGCRDARAGRGDAVFLSVQTLMRKQNATRIGLPSNRYSSREMSNKNLK